jgi:hypothetical protein
MNSRIVLSNPAVLIQALKTPNAHPISVKSSYTCPHPILK